MNNKSISHTMLIFFIFIIFAIIEPIHYLNMFTTKAYAETKVYLTSISLSEGNIDFTDNNYSYIVDVGSDVNEIIVRARPEEESSKVTINDKFVDKDTKYKEALPLKEGKNKIEVKVFTNLKEEVTYTLYVYRGGKEAVYLQDINIDNRDIGFSKSTSFYNIELDDDTEMIKLDVPTEGEEYSVKINDKLLSDSNSLKLKLNGVGKYDIIVTVIDNETKREKKYNLGIYVGIPVSPDISNAINDILKPNQWVIVNGRWRYNDSLGKCLKDAWFYDRNYKRYFHFNKRGNMETGWMQDGNWYYLNEHGAMQTGWLLKDKKWYYLNSYGAMKTGWIEDNDKYYYLNENGEMCIGWIFNEGKWYLLNQSGAMQTGWILKKGEWYYFNESGDMKTGWLKENENWYYLDYNGSMVSGKWIFSNGSWYYINYSGTMRTGWLSKDNKIYYLNNDGTMNTDTKIIEGYVYNFNSDGSIKYE